MPVSNPPARTGCAGAARSAGQLDHGVGRAGRVVALVLFGVGVLRSPATPVTEAGTSTAASTERPAVSTRTAGGAATPGNAPAAALVRSFPGLGPAAVEIAGVPARSPTVKEAPAVSVSCTFCQAASGTDGTALVRPAAGPAVLTDALPGSHTGAELVGGPDVGDGCGVIASEDIAESAGPLRC